MLFGLYLLSIYLACLVPASQSACDQGWFGAPCQFKCRCAKGCDVSGVCVNATSCSLGWFGPLCQYQDLANIGATATPNTSKATDGDDTSCSSLQNLTLSWPTAYFINWVQFIIPNASIATLPVMTFRVSQATNSTTLPCLNNQTKVYNTNTVDVYCTLTSAVQLMTLTFASNTSGLSVCSIYISGGRNLALKAATTQTSNYTSGVFIYDSSKAVDGNTSNDFNQNSCSSTNPGKVYWNLTFAQTVNVNRFILYNRKDLQDRLKGFKLLTLSRNNMTFNYTDKQTTALSVYTISPNTTVAADSISISVDNTLTLCEVEIYGDNTCDNKKFGMNCSKCRCNDTNEICFPTTGSCLSGCASGYFGDGCQQVCAPGSYGLQCKQTCGYCADIVCNPDNGVCPKGCVDGYTGPQCNQSR
ncbi:uncharacterized protein LOC131951614 [Physella acuta]|uniref:uncharacterized protein LOC131951614 n=1 Tax=Physella acuta TaxID=109671 RepID=UPI0027DD9E7E|nr:uncharacterized protein LOC131951614 [Physella acuta]